MQTKYQDNQFFKTYFNTINELGFTESAFYSLLVDRMQSSLKNRDRFTDDDGTYIIYPLEELMALTKFSKGKIMRIMKKLKRAGYVITKRPYGRANLIYLPKETSNVSDINSSSKIDPVEVPKQTPNQTEYKQTNKSKIYTVNTAAHELDKPSKLDLWKQAVVGKIGLTEQTANVILKQANNDLKVAYKLVKVITNARNSVVKENGLKRSKETDFQFNRKLVSGLTAKLRNLFSYLPAKFDEQARYMTTALKNYFKELLGLGEDNYVPKRANRLNSNFKREIPAWMNEKYDPSKDKLSPERKAELDRKMALLKAGV